MKLCLLLILYFIFQAPQSSGITLNGSSYAVLDQTYRFTCTATEASALQSLAFRKNGSVPACTLIYLLNSTQCRQFRDAPGYSCSCGQNGVYYMNISSVSQQDEVEWDCQLSAPTGSSPTSNTTSISVYYGPFNNVTIAPSSLEPVIEGVTTGSVRCSAHCKPGCSYTWRKGNQQVFNTRDLPLGSLTKNDGGNYTCRVSNTETGVSATADSQTLTVTMQWYPAQPTHNCPSWIVLGQSGSCTCQTSDPGNPAGTVQWINPQGQTVSSSQSTSVSLNLANIPRSDNGKNYICRANNSLVNSNRDIPNLVNIAYGPDTNQIRVTKPQDVVAIENRDLTLTCETLTSVSPGVTFTWDYSDGSAIAGGSTGAVTGSAGNTWSQTRTFQPFKSKTNIRCRVSNTRSSVTATGTLSLDVKWPPGTPSISDFPSPMYSGDQKTITCTVTGGNPLANITWSCYNTSNTGSESTTSRTSTREGSKTSSLTFLVTKQQNGQQCQCRATWTYGGYDESATKTFNVYYPPNKPTMTDPGSLCEGKSTSLTCSSSDPGNPSATYYWTKNTVSMATGSPYTFTPGRDDHQAQIRCDAGNDHTDRSGHSRPQSDVRKLNVYYTPRMTISPASYQTRKEGQSLSFTCSADSNPDNATLSWTFNGTTLTGVSVEKTNLSRSDHGVYTCTGRVNTGSVCPGGFLQGQRNANVIVNFAPDIIFNPVDIREGEALTLTCKANGRPETYTFGSFTQYWGDTQIDNRVGTTTGSQYTWTTQTATFLDTGVYECSVDNTVTDRQNVLVQRKRVSVHVRATPKFTTDIPQRVGAEVGSPVTLSQSFYNSYMNYTGTNWTFAKLKSLLNESISVTPSNVTLRKNDKAVNVEGFTASVVIEDFKEKDIGTYTVTACNSIGCSSSDVNLTAAGPPLVPLDFKVMNATQRSISLRWKPNFSGGDFTQVFILHYRLQGSEDWQTVEYEDNPGGYVYAEVTDLQPGSVYEFKVRARNTRENGNEGQYTDIIPGTTKSPETEGSSVVAIAAGAGVGSAVVILVAIAVIILVIRRRRQHDDGSKLALHEHGADKEKPEMHDNVLYDTSEGARGVEKPVMEDNVLYVGSGDIGGAASSGGAEYAVVQKKSNAKKKKEKTSGDIYATPQKKGKTTQKKAEKKKDKKKDKKDDKKQANLRKQRRGDVYENTVPGQFGAEASTYANAGFVGDENHYEETVVTETPAYGRDEDGLLYVGIDFGNQKPSQEVHGVEDATEYAGIAFGKVGAPLPPDEEEKNEEKK